MSASNRTVRGPLLAILGGGIVSWILFIAGSYFDTAVTIGLSTDELYGKDAIGVVYPSKYFIFLSIAVLGFSALVGKRRIVARASQAGNHLLARGAERFANLVMIVALVLAAIAGVAVFMDGFFSNTTGPGVARTLNLYIPIMLYTALLVTILLAGFVFTRQSGRTKRSEAAETAPAAPTMEPSSDSTDDSGRPTQRFIALGYAIPIIAVAVALILGLIVYDLTQAAPEVWIWVIIQTIVAAGIVLGTLFARRGTVPPQSGAAVGAKNLNFVLSIIFVGTVAAMALGYGTTAVEQLRVNTSVSLNVYQSNWMPVESDADGVPIEGLQVQADGWDLQRNSPARVEISPPGSPVLEGTADRGGYIYVEDEFEPDLEPGNYTLTFAAIGPAGADVSVTLDFVITDDERIAFPDGASVSEARDTPELLPVSAGWVVRDLLPPLLLALLTTVTLYLTLTIRNGREPEDQSSLTAASHGS